MVAEDGLAFFSSALFSLAAALALLLSVRYLREERVDPAENAALILFSACGMSFFAAATNLIVLFLGLETLSLSLYILAGHRRDNLKSGEAALKYFLLGAFSSAFLLYGIALLYGSFGSLDLLEISRKLQEQGTTAGVNPLALAAVALLLVGFGFKVALVPFHVWAPDVYEGAPTPITAFLAAGSKAAAFVALLRVFSTSLPNLRENWVPILVALSALSMLFGSIVAIAQTNIKRMLAYSSISHAGYLALGVMAGSPLGATALLFYLLAYVLVNTAAFGIVLAMGTETRENLELSDYAGLARRRPWLAAAMTIFMLSLTGIPPTAGFVGKWYLFGAAVQAGFVGLAVLGVLCSVVSAFFYLRVIFIMYMREPEGAREWRPAGAPLATAIVLGVMAALALGLAPSWWLSLAERTAASIFR
jgi:NADH-quinone oxidoreductase subunit N